MTATEKHNAYLSQIFGVPATLLPPAPKMPPLMPPADLLKRAGDGGLYWHPNPDLYWLPNPAAAPGAPASDAWIKDLLEYYWLTPGPDDAHFTFNRAPSTMATLTKLVAEQARLSGYIANAASVKAVAEKLIFEESSAQEDGKSLAQSESILADDEVAELGTRPMKEILGVVVGMGKAGQIGTIGRRARNDRVRLAVLSVMHDIRVEWSALMERVSPEDQEAVRKFVYRGTVNGDAAMKAPGVDGVATYDSRSLNSAEIAYVNKVFRGSIDYSKVTIVKGGLATVGAGARTIGNTIHIATEHFVKDSLELLQGSSDMLVHEMTHVWQYNHRGWTYAPAAVWARMKFWNDVEAWRPHAESHERFEDLDPETQAYAVEAYNGALRRAIGGNADPDDYETLRLVKPWVDAMLAGPKKK